MRVAFIYDHCHPHTVGGAERYYWRLTRELAQRHDVEYVTQTWWDGAGEYDDGGVRVRGICDPGETMTGGRRAVGPTLRFGAAVAWHLLRRGGRYDVVHVANFPHFAVLGAWLGLLAHPRTRLVADWHEVWRRSYWQEYLGTWLGLVGYVVQRLAVRLPDRAFAFSRLHAARLRAEGRRDEPVVIPEFVPEEAPAVNGAATGERERLVLFVGRLIPEKRADLVPAVVAELRRADPSWRARVYGSGPERDRIAAEAERHGVTDAVELPGFGASETIVKDLRTAAALLLPSSREGFGIVVLEATAQGAPVVVVAGPDNAAVELIEPGTNGDVAPAAEAGAIAERLLALAADPGVYARTAAWSTAARERFSPAAAASMHEHSWRTNGR